MIHPTQNKFLEEDITDPGKDIEDLGMKQGILRHYQYVKINDYFFCLQQNPAVLAWILFFKREDLIAIQPWLKKNYPRWKMIYFRYQWKIFKRDLITLIVFVQYKLSLRNVDLVHLPVYGQFGMAVHKGYKIFNLRSGVVTKIFDSDVNKLSILNEIERMKRVSQINFAPSLRIWDIDERWYQEDYIRGHIASAHRSADSAAFLKAFCREAVPCMNSLILFKRPSTKDLAVYLEELIGILEVSRLSRQSLDLKEANTFRNFVHSTVELLNAEGKIPVYLVFSHGDFCPANFLSTKDGIRIVDWETAGDRSLLFDFYSYFFYRATSNKLPVVKLVSEINEALPIFVSGLSLKAPEITENLSASVKIYRRLFYIEYLSKLVERDLTDNILNMTDYILRYIEAFSHYEEILNTDVTTFSNKTATV